MGLSSPMMTDKFSLLTVVATALMETVSALTLEEAKQNPKENILYDPTPYSKLEQFGFSSLLVYGSLILLTVSLAIGAKFNSTNPRRRAASSPVPMNDIME